MSQLLDNVKEQYGRVKGASWFPLLHKKDVMLLGQGGIGSWVAIALARIGINLYTFDMDTYESINLTGQLVRQEDIGKNKAVAIKEIISQFSPDCEVETAGEYKTTSMSNNIVICGFDNMKARKIAFLNWNKHVNGLSEENKKLCFFQDGRLTAEQFQIFNISGNRKDLREKYYKEQLFESTGGEEPVCTFKQTSHSAMMIAGHMTAFLTNWAFNSDRTGYNVRSVPFYYEYLTPLNRTTNDDRL